MAAVVHCFHTAEHGNKKRQPAGILILDPVFRWGIKPFFKRMEKYGRGNG